MSTHAQAVARIAQHSFVVHTRDRGLHDVTAQFADFVRGSGIKDGLANVYCHHTSCSLIVGENADPTVPADLERFFARLVPDGDPIFRHDAEGPDDMPAHVRSVLTATSIAIPVHGGKPALGTWQGLFLWEHRTRAHQRKLTVTVLGL
jgi:secondary thiamine-phosphate synthase enzyme